jgi:hypothetical protein
MLFDIPYIADWNKIGVYRQHQTDLNTAQENLQCADYDYKVGNKVLIRKDGILCKTESQYDSEPWTITTVHMNGTNRVERRTKSARELPHILILKQFRELKLQIFISHNIVFVIVLILVVVVAIIAI